MSDATIGGIIIVFFSKPKEKYLLTGCNYCAV